MQCKKTMIKHRLTIKLFQVKVTAIASLHNMINNTKNATAKMRHLYTYTENINKIKKVAGRLISKREI